MNDPILVCKMIGVYFIVLFALYLLNKAIKWRNPEQKYYAAPVNLVIRLKPKGEEMEALKIVAVTIDDANTGTVVISGDAPNQDLVFTPATDFVGTATGTYTIEDEGGGQSTAKWTVTVENPAPLAVDDVATTQKNTPVTLNVLGNDLADKPA